jgi:hypothetical protein
MLCQTGKGPGARVFGSQFILCVLDVKTGLKRVFWCSTALLQVPADRILPDIPEKLTEGYFMKIYLTDYKTLEHNVQNRPNEKRIIILRRDNNVRH